MTDEERREISDRAKAEAKTEASVEHRITANEKDIVEIKSILAWGVKAVWAAVVYLALQLWTFVSQGGALK